MIDWKSFRWFSFVFVLLLVLSERGTGQEPKNEKDGKAKAKVEKKRALAAYITITSPINDAVYAKVTNAAAELQHQAEQEGKQATLVLEINRGTSKFGQVRDLAKELTLARLARLRTIAWIPEQKDGKPVDGNNVILALACKEIIMHPDAEMGDIGRGEAVDPDERDSVVRLVQKRHNRKVNAALAQGMMDPQQVVLRIKLEIAQGNNKTTESRVVTPEELKRLRDNRATILDVETIKEAGTIGTLSGSRARALDVLVVLNAERRSDIADHYNLPMESLRENATIGEAPKARLIRIEGMIEPILEGFVEREIRRAESSDVNLLIFEIDSPGGYLLSSTNLANRIADLDPEKIRTVAYIPKMALSGAAIIALGCSEIYLFPDAQIGDAGPIEMREGGQFERAPEKIVGHLRETLAALAEKKGRPKALAEAMADKDLKVFQVRHSDSDRVWFMSDEEIHISNGEWIKGRLVPESKEENLLTVNGRRAHELKIAEVPVEDWVDMRQRMGIPEDAKLVASQRTWVDTLVYFLNSPLALFLLFFLGGACIFLELHTTSGFFGIGAAVCFSVFFWSRFLGGTAGWLEIVLFVLGLAMIGLEIFVIPGFGVFGVSGGLLVMVALVLASQTFVIPTTSGQVNDMVWTMGTLSSSICSVIVLAMIMSKYLPRMPLLNHMILAPPYMADGHDLDEPQLSPEFSGQSSIAGTAADSQTLLSKQGVTMSVLRPAGKARIDDRLVDVVSDGPFIPEGSDIEVVEVAGNRVVVRQV